MGRELILNTLGLDTSQIANSFRDPTGPEEVDEMLKEQRLGLSISILESIITRASKQGDLEAVAWLESRGIVTLPKAKEE